MIEIYLEDEKESDLIQRALLSLTGTLAAVNNREEYIKTRKLTEKISSQLRANSIINGESEKG